MLYDLTPPISDALGVWPGDTPPSREVLADMARGANITLSTLRATVHLGAHADAPSHYGRDAPAIDARPTDLYLGRCDLMRVAVERGRRVLPEHLPRAIGEPRLLVCTGTFPDPGHWNDDFAALSPELVAFAHDHGVRLIGIDTPSVDLFAAKELLAHRQFLKYDMAILEGLALSHVPEGVYELIALPLPLVGFDASPVRAVLRTIA
ncbi:MAG: cyclase family protein [Planctomycetes bacterium]|nr:cyclase family protein [Planctomycetota bacterium]